MVCGSVSCLEYVALYCCSDILCAAGPDPHPIPIALPYYVHLSCKC
jgi:hypothetical protein